MKKKMLKESRILMGVPHHKIKMGGPTTHLPYLVDFFEKSEQYDIRTFSYGSKVDGGSLIDKKEGTLSKILNSLQVFVLFIYQVIVYRPHIIHINSAFVKNALIRDVPYALFSFIFRKKLIIKLHGSSYELINTQNKIFLFLIRLLFLGAGKIGVLSEIERKEFISKFGNAGKLVVVKNIVKTKAFTTGGPSSYFEKDPSKIYGLFVSRIIKGKGLNDVIRALPSILKVNPGFVLLVAGDGPEKDNCIKLANDLKVQDSVNWLGFVPNESLPGIFIQSDIFLFLSHFPEGMPMSLVEALQCGIPIVTTKVRFAVNYLQDYKNCLFVDAGNLPDIEGKIIELIVSKDLQMQMKKINPEIVEKFSQAIVGNEFIMIYRQMYEIAIEKPANTVLNRNNSGTINSLQ